MTKQTSDFDKCGQFSRVDDMIRQYLKADGKPPKPSDRIIYHYTSLDVLNEMCKENGDLFCTHFMSLNDSQEFFLGVNLVINKLPTILSPSEIRQYKLEHFQENAYNEMLQMLRTESIAPWVTSFSADPDSLYQWVAYTDRKQGGMAIGFDITLLNKHVSLVQDNPKLNHVIGCRLEKCQYVDSTSLDAHIRNVIVSWLAGSTSSKKTNTKASIFAAIYILASTIKNQSFSQEKESRLIMIPTRKEGSRRYKFVGGKPRIATEFFGTKHKLAKAISSVVISPHGDRSKLVSSVNLLRQQLNLTFPIFLSSSSYNGR